MACRESGGCLIVTESNRFCIVGRFGKGRKSADDVVPHRSRSRSEERPSFGPVLHQHHQPPAVIVEGDVPLQHQKLG